MSDVRTKTFKLKVGLLGHGKQHHEIVLREPKFSDWAELGNPYVIQPDNNVFPLPDRVAAYIERCLIEPADPVLVSTQADMVFAMEASEWIVGFTLEAFVVARSRTLPTTSSSNAASPSAT